jgi:hypothetical protein
LYINIEIVLKVQVLFKVTRIDAILAYALDYFDQILLNFESGTNHFIFIVGNCLFAATFEVKIVFQNHSEKILRTG